MLKTKSIFRAAIAIIAAFSFASGQGAAEHRAPDAQLRQSLQKKLDEWHAAGKFPGATLGVVLANGESFGLAAGFSDAEAKTRMRPNDRMLAGSVGKTFAAAVALQLADEGKIDLDAKIEKYLGKETWFARLPNARDITIRQLMNHTSGLVRYEFKPEFVRDLLSGPDKDWKPIEQTAYVFDEKPPFEAGKGWEYSDTNYIVLGMIMEKVTGRAFYDLADERLIKRYKLAGTTPSYGPKIDGLIQGYAGEQNIFNVRNRMIEDGRLPFNPKFEWTGGGYVSTSEDLARWARLLYGGDVLKPAMKKEMLDGVAARLGPNARYGLGVIIRPTDAGMSYGHSGFFPGYLTDMMYFPEKDIAIAVQVNTSVGQTLGKPLSRLLAEMAEAIEGPRKIDTGRAETGRLEN
ncbi:MAG TPA: serine hydrolase domain-containing protein [Pyrinomonadaceae bacterium]|nr:serine hydrolase domain-containing protein [Pyrinomonadaceae bacterium]HMP64430.1 serine hydrolase domain-containing protein [Pyrinomonadaceae bacterium]